MLSHLCRSYRSIFLCNCCPKCGEHDVTSQYYSNYGDFINSKYHFVENVDADKFINATFVVVFHYYFDLSCDKYQLSILKINLIGPHRVR